MCSFIEEHQTKLSFYKKAFFIGLNSLVPIPTKRAIKINDSFELFYCVILILLLIKNTSWEFNATLKNDFDLRVEHSR